MSDEDENSTDAVDTDRVDDETLEGEEKLGDPGKRALDEMKEKWRTERDRRKALEQQIAATVVDDKKDDVDPAKVREQARAEARAEVLRDRALDKIEAKASKLFADPEDAALLLGRRIDEFIDGGKLDLDAIEDALEDLLKKKPHLAAATAPRFSGSADGGARKGSGQPTQLTENDLKRMTPDQIVAAQDKGQLNELLGIT